MMTPQQLLQVLLIAANAKTDEEKARIIWRASDYMWENVSDYGILFCREFNNLCQDFRYPWIKDLWSEEEQKAKLDRYRSYRYHRFL